MIGTALFISLFSVQLGTGGDVGVDHQEMEPLVTVLLVDGRDQHTLGIDAHHLSGGQIHNGDGGFATSSSGS